MGGDQLVAALAGGEVEKQFGDEIRDAESELYKELIDEVETMEGSRELIEDLREAGNVVVLASSAKDWEVEHYLELLDAKETLAVLTGGFSEQELRGAGAKDVFTSVDELRRSLVETPLSG